LRDFDLHQCFVGIPEGDQDRRIEISYEKLARYLNEAEAQYEMENRGLELQLPAGKREAQARNNADASIE